MGWDKRIATTGKRGKRFGVVEITGGFVSWKCGKYYHRSKRIGGRVTSEYVGSGHSALIMAQLDEHERQQKQVQRRAQKELQKRDAAIDAKLDELGEGLQQILAALYLVSGYHTHKRQWRKARKNNG